MNRLKELRLEKGISQTQLGKFLNCTDVTISRYEQEKRQLEPGTIHKICEIFGCTADYLLGFSDVARQTITLDEWRLLDAYSRASLRDRALVDQILSAYVEAEKGETAK